MRRRRSKAPSRRQRWHAASSRYLCSLRPVETGVPRVVSVVWCCIWTLLSVLTQCGSRCSQECIGSMHELYGLHLFFPG
jgi:hypothetical protein